jgi:hypothetical protein
VDQLRQAEAEQQAHQAAECRKRDGLAEEEQQDGSPPRAERDQQADFAGAFGDGDGHDGDDADAADQQRDAAQRADGHGQHVEDVGQRAQHLFLGDDGEILAAVAGDQASLMAPATMAEGTPSSAATVDFVEPSRLNISWARAAGMKAVSSRSMPRNWPFGFHDADHAEVQAADAQALAERRSRCRTVRS